MFPRSLFWFFAALLLAPFISSAACAADEGDSPSPFAVAPIEMKAENQGHAEALGVDTTTPAAEYTALKLLGVNKITAKAESFEAMIGTVTRFGNLEIIPRACWESPPEVLQKEQAGLMEVWHWKPGEKPTLVFFGWMFASSPSLSSLAHPVYDISMIGCAQKAAENKK